MGPRAFGYITDMNDPDPPVLGQLLDEPAVVPGHIVVPEPPDEAEHHQFLAGG